jgi:hypothetical protein
VSDAARGYDVSARRGQGDRYADRPAEQVAGVRSSRAVPAEGGPSLREEVVVRERQEFGGIKVVVAMASLGGAILGGATGTRYHREVDRVGSGR